MSVLDDADDFSREGREYRDDRLFYIGCDDRYAPDQYFGFFKMPRIKICVVPALDDKSHAVHVLEKLRDLDIEDDDERWMVLDTDHCLKPDHFGSLETAISEARQMGIRIAISRPSFEAWLLLHHAPVEKLLSCADADAVGEAIREVLGHYNKTKLQAVDFPLESVPQACDAAAVHDATVTGGDKPNVNTTRVYKIWQSIVMKAPLLQLPECLHEFALKVKGMSIVDEKK